MSHDVHKEFTVKRLLVDLLMGIIFMLLFSFSLWLIWVTFFREYFDTGIIENTKGNYFQTAATTRVKNRARFHYLEEPVSSRDESVSTCISCHDELAHFKSKDTRAFLNAHSYFMACEVCHAEIEGGGEVVYRWSDTKTGQYLNSRPDNAIAKITPTAFVRGSIQSLESATDKEFIKEYLEIKDTLNESQIKVVVERTHKNMLNSPISCIDCHTVEKKPFLPFTQLAYSTARIEELKRIEVLGMIKKYENFYMPDLSQGTGSRN